MFASCPTSDTTTPGIIYCSTATKSLRKQVFITADSVAPSADIPVAGISDLAFRSCKSLLPDFRY